MKVMTMKSIPNRPAISNVLIKASANDAFRAKLLANSNEVLAEMDLPPEDVKILSGVQAASLKEYARRLKMRLLLYHV